jgi:hypothetical protein
MHESWGSGWISVSATARVTQIMFKVLNINFAPEIPFCLFRINLCHYPSEKHGFDLHFHSD